MKTKKVNLIIIVCGAMCFISAILFIILNYQIIYDNFWILIFQIALSILSNGIDDISPINMLLQYESIEKPYISYFLIFLSIITGIITYIVIYLKIKKKEMEDNKNFN